MATFTPPSVLGRSQTYDFFFERIRILYGQTVLKFGTSYRTVTDPAAEDIDAADIAYLGGHTYPITDTEAAELTAAGYQVDQ